MNYYELLIRRSRNQSPQDNEIWYYAPEQVTLYSETDVTSHTFSGGRGVIRYSSAVTTVPATLREVTTITDVQFPSTVTSIGDNTFASSSIALTSLPEGVTSIGVRAFDRCHNLALTALPAGVTSIGDSAFFDCSSLALTSLPEGLTSIRYVTFANCPKLALTSLPEGVTSIGEAAFAHCPKLALTELPGGLTSIGVNAFYDCTGLTSITFLGTPTTLDATAFGGCTNLKDIYVPWAEGDIADAPWGATNATVHYTEPGGGAISFPDSFSVTDCSYNGAAVGQYSKTSEKTTINGVDYPVYSRYYEMLGTTFYIFVCDKFNGTSGAYWALNGDSEYSSTMDGNNTLGAVSVGADGLPSSTTWTSANGTATVSWS